MRVDQLVPYGYTDTAISTFHAFGDRLVREFALELGLPPDVRVLVAPGDRGLPARAPVRARARRVPPARRPDPVPRRARDAVLAGEGRGRLARRLPGARRAARRRGREAAADSRRRRPRPPTRIATPRPRSARRPAGRRSSPRAYARYQELLAANGVDRLRRPGVARAPAAARLAGRARGRPAPLPVHPGRRVPGHEPGPVRARRARRRAAPQRDGRRRRRPVDLQVPRRGDQQHPRVPRALPARRGTSSCAGTTARARRSSTRPTASSATTTRIGSRSRAGIVKRLRPERGGDDAPPVRHEAFATGARGGGLDRRRHRAPDPRRRGTARPRRARPRQRRRGPDPAGAQPRGRSRGGSPARAGCTPARRCGCCSRSCARSRTRRSSRRRLRARGLRPVRPRRRGPRRDREHGPPPQPHRCGTSSRSSSASRGSCASPRRPARAATRLVEDLRRYVALAHERPAGEVLYAFLRGTGLARAGSRRAESVAAEEALSNIARFFDIVRGPVGAPRRRPRGVRRPPPAAR